jgi:hypothetical protein
MNLTLINQDISESRLYRQNSLSRLTGKEIANLLYLNILSLYLLSQTEPDAAKSIAAKTAQYAGFALFRTTATDVYILAYQVAHPDNKHIRMREGIISKRFLSGLNFDSRQLWRFISDIRDEKINPSRAFSYLMRLETQLRISDGAYKTLRRDIVDWEKLSVTRHQAVLRQLGQHLRRLAQQSEAVAILSAMGVKQDTLLPASKPSLSRKLAGAAAGGIVGNIAGKKLAKAISKPSVPLAKIGTGLGAIAGYWAAGRTRQR